jgi:gluconate 2-dehydrogenase gamma chain
MNPEVTRRRFLLTGGSVGGVTWLKLSAPGLAALTASACTARDADTRFLSLSDDEASTIAAMAARFIPTTETPGATEAGVIHFIDQAFNGELAGDLAAARAELLEFQRALDSLHPGTSFPALSADAQDALLADQEGSAFFERIREMTILGFFAMSSHGGNRDHLSWDLIGFQGHGAWAAPFGYYDQEANAHGG